MADTRRINIVLPDNQIKMLRLIARRERRTMSSVLRQAVEEFTGAPDRVRKYDDSSKYDDTQRA